ncbi:MAG TPA: pyridoxamine 5'-phosphate oxidase family protein [Acidimicrobiales bacterium]|nr:pyridoxamine 5'-phosphate oxidase family protein [Acidimicrobiales bacterium]
MIDKVTTSGAGQVPHEAALSLVELGRAECLALLEGVGVGRVVFSADCLPVALPVNLAVVDDSVVFSTGFGGKFEAARRGEVLTIEADEIDRIYHTGWSVLVTGVAEVLPDSAALGWAEPLLTQSWLRRPDARLVRVPATLVSGRRLEWTASGTGAP